MIRFAVTYGLTFAAFTVLDFIWLSVMSGKIYRPMMGDLLRDSFSLPPAVVFYLLYAFGLTWFAVYPAVAGHASPFGLSPVMGVLVNGLMVGLIGYGTYNLTALSVLRNWSLPLSAIDMGWGAFVSAVASAIAFLLISLRN